MTNEIKSLGQVKMDYNGREIQAEAFDSNDDNIADIWKFDANDDGQIETFDKSALLNSNAESQKKPNNAFGDNIRDLF